MSQLVQVILLNGVSSVGKSSTAKALQRIADKPFLIVALDSFLDMLPERTLGDPDGIRFEVVVAADPREVAIHTGPTVERALSGMRHAVAALAAQGNNLIVDEVLFQGPEEAEYRALLAAHHFRMVGLLAPLEVIEDRERRRGDRDIGQARWQYDRVHAGRTYDLEIDTSLVTAEQAAQAIKDAFAL